MKTSLPVSRADIEAGLSALGVTAGMAVETHCSLSSFGHVAGGAEAVIDALMHTVGSDGAIVMPAFRLSPRLPLTEEDRELGLTCKIRILGPDEDGSDMGIVAETFRRMPGIVTGRGLFRVSAWGKDAEIHAATGLQHLIDVGGSALLLGVDIYSLSAMHYVEDDLPDEIRNRFRASEEARKRYPDGEWFIEAWEPIVKPWYTIQDRAYERGFIKAAMIGASRCMLLDVNGVIGLYRDALRNNPLGLYGIR